MGALFWPWPVEKGAGFPSKDHLQPQLIFGEYLARREAEVNVVKHRPTNICEKGNPLFGSDKAQVSTTCSWQLRSLNRIDESRAQVQCTCDCFAMSHPFHDQYTSGKSVAFTSRLITLWSKTAWETHSLHQAC